MKPSDFELILKRTTVSDIGSSSKFALWCSNEFLVEEKSEAKYNKCKKFEISKIQSVCYYQTKGNLIVMLVCGGIGFVLAICALSVLFSIVGLSIFLGVLSVIFLGILTKKMIDGHSCNLYLITAVGEHKLEGVKTMKRAQIMVEKLNVYINNSQGGLDNDDLKTRIDELSLVVTRKPQRAYVKSKKK